MLLNRQRESRQTVISTDEADMNAERIQAMPAQFDTEVLEEFRHNGPDRSGLTDDEYAPVGRYGATAFSQAERKNA